MSSGENRIGGWGRFPIHNSRSIQFADLQNLNEVRDAIPRGNGRSYGDSAVARLVIQMSQYNAIYNFDEDNGILHAQSGILLKDILQHILPYGFSLPVLPGTKYVTLGGAIASDVHGKNHHYAGTFCNHVLSIFLIGTNQKIIECSQNNNPQLFADTCGGMGLTGIIESASIRLIRIKSGYFKIKRQKITGFNNLINQFQISGAEDLHQFAWLNMNDTSLQNVQSIFYSGQACTKSEHFGEGKKQFSEPKPEFLFKIPDWMPGFLLNRFSSGIVNTLIYLFSGNNERYKKFYDFHFPLDKVKNWNQLYGTSGLIQYHFIVPEQYITKVVEEICRRLRTEKVTVFLAVLKSFGPIKSKGTMSFAMPGYSLAMDFKKSVKVLKILEEFDQVILDTGGRVYLAKDSRMSATTFHRSYKQKVQRLSIFNSYQSERLNI